MKNIILVIILFLTTLFSTEKQTINVVLGLDKPPFIFGKTSNKGIEPDLLKEIFNNMGYKLNMVQKTKDYMQTILNKQNNIDIVATISPSNTKLFYSDSFTTYENFVITRKSDHFNIENINDLKFIQFVAWNGAYNDLGDEFYNLFNPINGTAKQSYNNNTSQKDDMQMFLSKKVNAIIIDKTIFNWFKLHFNDTEEYDFHSIFKDKKSYPVTFKSKELRDEFNIALKKIKLSGRYNEIMKFYETQDVEELLTFTNLLANLSSKYIFDNKITNLQKLLKTYFTHPDLLSINITNENNQVILNI